MVKIPLMNYPDPDPDHLRGGPNHGENTSCVKKQVNRAIVFSYVPGRTVKQTQMYYHCTTMHTSPEVRQGFC